MFTALIRAARVLKCDECTDLSTLNATAPFNVYIVPLAASALEVGDVVIVEGDLCEAASQNVPVNVGDWTPAIFDNITAVVSAEDGTAYTLGTDYRLFVGKVLTD